MRRFLIALQFMTVFRVKNDLRETSEDLAASVAWYPLAGLVLGLLLCGAAFLLHGLVPAAAGGVLLVMLQAAFTRGLHLDGLADTADGLLSHRDRARMLEIMKDSAIGTFGALALIFTLGLKAALLAGLPWPQAWPALLLFPLWGRLAASLTASLSVYARAEGGLGRPFVDLAGKRELAWAGLTALLASTLIGGPAGLAALLVVSLAALAGVVLWRRVLGGVTGDVLGAVIELGETLGLLAAALFLA